MSIHIAYIPDLQRCQGHPKATCAYPDFQIVVYVALGSRLCENSIIPAWMANCALCKRSQGHLADYFRQSVSWSGEMFLHIYFERTPVRCWVSSFYGANTGIEACICGTKQAYSAPHRLYYGRSWQTNFHSSISQILKTICRMASRVPVVATAEHSDQDFLVFTQSGPKVDAHPKQKRHPRESLFDIVVNMKAPVLPPLTYQPR